MLVTQMITHMWWSCGSASLITKTFVQLIFPFRRFHLDLFTTERIHPFVLLAFMHPKGLFMRAVESSKKLRNTAWHSVEDELDDDPMPPVQHISEGTRSSEMDTKQTSWFAGVVDAILAADYLSTVDCASLREQYSTFTTTDVPLRSVLLCFLRVIYSWRDSYGFYVPMDSVEALFSSA